jgi:hypothetical protein
MNFCICSKDSGTKSYSSLGLMLYFSPHPHTIYQRNYLITLPTFVQADSSHISSLDQLVNHIPDNYYIMFQYATVEIHHIPCVHVNVVPGLFFMPAFSTFFPMLPSDLPTITEWLRTKVT